MTLIGNIFRWIHGKVSNKPTNFSWVIDNKLAGSGTPMTSAQYNWLIKNKIKSIVTVREFPLPEKWLVDNEKETSISMTPLAMGWARVEDKLGFKQSVEHFLDCVLTRKQPLTNGVDALKTHQLMNLILKKAGLPDLE